MLSMSGITKKNRIRIEVKSIYRPIYSRRLLITDGLVILTRVLYLNLSTHHLALTIDEGVTPIAKRSLPRLLPTSTHYKFTTLRIPPRKLNHNLQSWVLGLRGTGALMGLYILRKDRRMGWGKKEETSCWNDRSDIFDLLRLWEVCGRQGRDFGWLARRASIVDESTALLRALDGTKEVWISCYKAITPCQDFSDISARPPGRSWNEARKAEGEFPEVHISLQRPAGQPLRTHQKDYYVFGFSPNVGIRRAPHPVAFAIFADYYTPANSHRFVGWREEIMKG